MNEELEKLIKERDELDNKISNFVDGFKYELDVLISANIQTFSCINYAIFHDAYLYYKSTDNGIIQNIRSNNIYIKDLISIEHENLVKILS